MLPYRKAVCSVVILMIVLFQDTSRRYENKAGSFITGIDVTSKVFTDSDVLFIHFGNLENVKFQIH